MTVPSSATSPEPTPVSTLLSSVPYFCVLDNAVHTDVQLQLSARIGRGSGGFVFSGSLLKDGKEAVKIALKLSPIKADAASDLVKECVIWGRLQHPHIAMMHGYFCTSTHIGMVSELFGGSLEERHSKLKELKAPPPTIAALSNDLRQIASAMEYLHGLTPEPVLHRDLKAANVLLMPPDGRLAITDFGISRYLPNDGRCMTGETGSYRWMAPEVLLHMPYDERCDVYSFAILAWEMLTYGHPFDDHTPLQAAFGVIKGERPPMPPACPLPIAVLIQRCWQQQASARPLFSEIRPLLETIGALEADLEDLQQLSSSPLSCSPRQSPSNWLRHCRASRERPESLGRGQLVYRRRPGRTLAPHLVDSL